MKGLAVDPFLKLATAAAFALALAGCGLKGALDPPPGPTAAAQAGVAGQQTAATQTGVGGQPTAPPQEGEAAPATRKHFFLDFLLD